MNNSKIALVLGVTGGFGQHMALALLAKGWSVVAVMRNSNKLPEIFDPFLKNSELSIVVADAMDSKAITTAAEKCSVIIYGLNIPYAQWEKKAEALLEVSIQAAEQLKLTFLFPGNVYNFDPSVNTVIDEQSSMVARTPKGKIRINMEQRLKRASENGAKVVILRAGDFIGLNAPSTWISFLLKKSSTGYKLASASENFDLIHSWCYLPDLAKAGVDLIEQQSTEDVYRVFHFAGHQFSFNQLAKEIEETSGLPVKLSRMPWWFYRLLSPFTVFIREILEMQYLWETELNLDGSKLAAALPDLNPSSLSEVLVGAGLVER